MRKWILFALLLIAATALAQDNWPEHRGDMRGVAGVGAGGVITGGIIYCEPPISDTLPMVCYLQGADAWEQATGGNRVGGNLVTCGGLGTRQFTIDNFAVCAGDNVTLSVDSSPVITLTEGAQWNAGASNNAACISLAAAVEASVVGPWVTATCPGGGAVVYMTFDPRICSVGLTESDATCTTFTYSSDGELVVPPGTGARPGILGANDTDTGLYFGLNTLGVTTGGTARTAWTTTAVNFVGLRVYDSTGPLQLGTAAATGHALATGDVLVGGKLEVDADTWFDGAAPISTNGFSINAGVPFSSSSGAASYGGYYPRVTPQTPDTSIFTTGSVSNAMIICEDADRTFDFTHALQTNPTLFIHSANQATNEWISLTHNASNGVIATGVGGILLNSAAYADQGIYPTSSDAGVSYDPFNQAQTPDTGSLMTGSTANSIIICEYGDTTYDFAHPVQTNPTVFIQSATQSATQWLSLAHNQTGGVISTGAGMLDLNPATAAVMLPSVIAAVPAEPTACAAAAEGATVYVDDTNDTAYGQVCICSNKDGTGYDWRLMSDIVGTACPFF